MKKRLTPDIILPDESIQYVSDHEGTVQSVLVPIDLWRNLLTQFNLSEFDLVGEKSAQDPAEPPSLFGAFPALAALEFGDNFESLKQVWQEGLDKR
ncbi:MAG: hypothetical protein KF893_15540 [Caldilineaceae bacterium]|nr:hypothetical protein [Caldilineaceae bacterium]